VRRRSTICIVLFLLCLPALSFAATQPVEQVPLERLLAMNLEQLIEVNVSLATKRQIPVRKAPAIATVITAAEIRNMGARDLTDVLALVPGFSRSITEFGSSMFEVRGTTTQLSEKILLMVDGHPLNRNFVGSGLYYVGNDLPVDNIRQIEVIRGPGSALYGANAFLATVNVITRDAGQINGVEINAAGGSFDTRKANLSGGRVFANGLELSGSLDYYKTNGEDQLIEKDAISATPWSTTPGNADYVTERSDMFVKAAWGGFTFRGQYTAKRAHGLYIGMAYALTDDSAELAKNYWGELTYNRKMTDKLASMVKLYYDRYEQEAIIEVEPEGVFGLFPEGMIGSPFLKDKTHGAELQLDYDLSAANHLIFGAAHERMNQFDVRAYNNFDPRVFPPVPIDLGPVQDISAWANWQQEGAAREIQAFYLQDEWKIKDNLNLTAGVRYDHYSEFGATTNPRAALVWGFLQNVDLKLLYGRAFRAPNFVELYNKNNPVNIGNPAVKPEIIETYEAGLGMRLARSFTLDVNYFYNKIDDLIAWDASTSPAVHVNAGRQKVEGVELALAGRYTVDNYWKLAYIYQDPREEITGARLPNVPYQRAAFSVNYGLTRDLILHTDILWTGKRPREAADPRPEMPAYATVDLAMIHRNFVKNMEISLSAHNLLNKKYRDPDRSGAAQLIPNDFPRDGMVAMLGVRYKF